MRKKVKEGVAKSQSSLETIVLMGVMFILIIPLFFLSTSRLEGSRESSLDQNAETTVTGVNQLISLGEGSSKTIVINNPSGIEWADVVGSDLQIGWKGGVMHWRMPMQMQGDWPASEGLHEVRLFNAGNVIIVILCGNNLREGFEQCDGADGGICPLAKAPPQFPPIVVCGAAESVNACECLCTTNANCPPGHTCVSGACEKTGCGDDTIQSGEECDLGDLNNPPGIIGGSGCACDEDDVACTSGVPPISIGPLAGTGESISTFQGCRWPTCGDGIVNNIASTSGGSLVNYDGVPEQCDDGNTIPGDGCNELCQTEACGNGVFNPGEQCGDPGTPGCAGGLVCLNCLCITPFCSFDYECTGYPNMECEAGTCVPKNECVNNRVAQWNLDDAGPVTAVDSKGSNDLDKVGSGVINFGQPGAVCGSIEFTGTPAFLGKNILAASPLNFGADDDFSVEFLVKSTTTNQNPLIVGKYGFNWPREVYVVGYTGNPINRIGALLTDVNLVSISIEWPLDIGDGQWHHIVFVRLHTSAGSKIMRLYVDGTPTPIVIDDATGSIASDGIFGIGSPVGAVPITLSPWTEFSGFVEGVVVYDTALSDSMVQTHYTKVFVDGTRYCGETCPGSFCGDGVAQWPNNNGEFEECDGPDLQGETCATVGYLGGGTLSCNPNCTLNTDSCIPAPQVLCGNNLVNPPYEDCDRGNICLAYVPDSCNRAPGTSGATCSCPPGTPLCDVYGMTYPSGCMWPTCGDNVVNNWVTLASGEQVNYDLITEQCDGPDFNGMTCNDFGFTGGTLGCKAPGAIGECTLETTSCTGPMPPPLPSSPPIGHGGPGGGGGCAPIATCPTCGNVLVCGGSCPPEAPLCQTHGDHCDCMPLNLCGNGVLDPGEGCDPPGITAPGGCAICPDGTILCGTVTCESNCQWGPIVWPSCPASAGGPAGGGVNCGDAGSGCVSTGTGSGPCRDLLHPPGTTPAGKAPVCGGGCPVAGETCEQLGGSDCQCMIKGKVTPPTDPDAATGEPVSAPDLTVGVSGKEGGTVPAGSGSGSLSVWQSFVGWLTRLFEP